MVKSVIYFCLAVPLFAHSEGPATSIAVTLHKNINNVYGRAAYKKNEGVVIFLGAFNRTEDCETACIEMGKGVCRSFTYHQADMIDPDPRSFATLCYGVTDRSWVNVTEINVTSGVVHWPLERCKTDEDCSLNGLCDATGDGRCHCLAAWSGPTCGVLNTLRVSRRSGLHAPGSMSPNTSSWGGSVAYDDESKTFQMFAAEMVRGCGIGAWETNSRIVRAVSATADGEYEVQEVIKPAFAHEPVLARLSDGRWLLFSIGNSSSSSGPRTDCEQGYTPRANQIRSALEFSGPVPVEVLVSNTTSLTGGWTPLGHAIGQGDINPAPLVFHNGTTVMMWRGGDEWYHIHLARAHNWSGTYSYDGVGTIFPGFDRHGIEDPYLYTQRLPRSLLGDQRAVSSARPIADMITYHAIFHDHSTYGGHAYSRDGVSWTYSNVIPFSNKITYEDGELVELQRRERPHLIFDDRGFITHITNGVQPPPSKIKHPPSNAYQNDFTYTLVQPVQRQH